ncbi:WD40 repeat-like protein [Pluteus cervinus]|uniref:WD40 repeat-like protein n=1 Tax=Pluteus cervinus TaxID=181527 RepID=A0ACD3AE81_9AGAR|nr:WD40 repeat-like protein [Pluteus cervinus]
MIFQPESNILFTGTSIGTIESWDSYSGHVIGSPIKTWVPISVLAVLAGKHVLYASSFKEIMVWDIISGQQVFQPIYYHKGAITGFAITTDKQHLISSSRDASVVIWNITETFPSLKHVITCPDGVEAICLSPNNHYLSIPISSTSLSTTGQFLHIAAGQMLCIWQTKNWNKLQTIGHNSEVVSFALSKDESTVICGLHDKTLSIWVQEDSCYTKAATRSYNAPITALAHFPSVPLIAIGLWNFSIEVCNIETEQRVWGPFVCHTSPITSISIFSNCSRVVTGGSDGTIRIWETNPEAMLSDTKINTKHNQFPPKVQFLQYPSTFNLGFSTTADGWLTNQNQLILWIPPWYRQSVISPQVQCIPSSAENQTLKLDWSNFVYGTHWFQIVDCVL